MAAADSTGLDLIARGCLQGALVAAPARMVWLRASQPANANSVDWEVGDELLDGARLVIGSQDCDIAAPAKVEPFVELLTARWTTDPNELLAARKRNSARLYPLIDERTKILVADARRKVPVEKSALKNADFTAVLPNERERTRFGKWIAGRYSRPAIRDEVVQAVQKPLVKALEKLIGKTGEIRDIVGRVDEFLFRLSGAAPWTADFVAMLEEGMELSPEEEAELSGWIEETLVVTDGAIDRVRVLFRTPKALSLHDYVSMTRLSLDHFSHES
jgi:hypothetical protein